jgi:hypothetical protein
VQLEWSSFGLLLSDRWARSHGGKPYLEAGVTEYQLAEKLDNSVFDKP